MCRDPNHKIPQCDKKNDIPKSQWWINQKPQGEQNAQGATQATQASSSSGGGATQDQEAEQVAAAWKNLQGIQGMQ